MLRDRLDRTGWPRNMRVFVRRRRLAPGEKPTLFHIRGYKYTAFVTNTATTAQLLDARHRAHARVEDDVRTTKDTGLGHLPGMGGEQRVVSGTTIAVDLLAWLRLLGYDNPSALSKAEPKTLRYRLLTIPGRLVRGQRLRTLRLPRHWPWSAALVAIINKIRRIPLPEPVPG